MKKELSDYNNPLEANEDFEKALAKFTGASGVVVTDSVEHALELGLRYSKPKMYATIPPNAHFSVPMLLQKLGIEFMYSDDKWENEYRINGSIVYNASQHLAKDMFQTETPVQKKIVCLSLGPGTPMGLEGGGAILTNNREAYDYFKLAANDGRDLAISNWEDQKEFYLGYHYGMRPADAIAGFEKLANEEIADLGVNGYGNYPDLRDIVINK
jgi:dTDP-4-amino-4,6-dideoxygalactose transaminase